MNYVKFYTEYNSDSTTKKAGFPRLYFPKSFKTICPLPTPFLFTVADHPSAHSVLLRTSIQYA